MIRRLWDALRCRAGNHEYRLYSQVVHSGPLMKTAVHHRVVCERCGNCCYTEADRW